MKKHILLIDDDKDELGFIVTALDTIGMPYKCTWAQSGEQAIEQLQYLAPDYILLDINLPGIDGFQTLAHIKRLPGRGEIPVILYSTGMNKMAEQKGMALGAAFCIQKPDNLQGFCEGLKTVLATGHAMAAID